MAEIVNTYNKENFTEKERQILSYFANKFLRQMLDEEVKVKTRYAEEEDIKRLIEKLKEWNEDEVDLIDVLETKLDAMTSIMVIAVRLW
ncbi:hypothetical protein A7C91_01855 [Thermococcus piezophilus]|uniref:Uncharacterized protein n=1 Tax=Thermococcus piezophilus TaxID=1712654 RepID=A0A172WF75_9EURY|nr:hypothetical protein A7C91_01855 [Thermococcus piezophilus]